MQKYEIYTILICFNITRKYVSEFIWKKRPHFMDNLLLMSGLEFLVDRICSLSSCPYGGFSNLMSVIKLIHSSTEMNNMNSGLIT